MKSTTLLAAIFLLSSGYAYSEGQEEVDGWNVRWADTDGNGSTYARIEKRDNVADHDDMKLATMAIGQNIYNEIYIDSGFTYKNAKTPCVEKKTSTLATAKVNSREIRMELSIRTGTDCVTFHNWKPVSDAGAEFVRSEFNSGVFRFSHGFFDHIFDTRNNSNAYELMKEMVRKEEQAAAQAL